MAPNGFWNLVAEHFPGAIQIVGPLPRLPASLGGGSRLYPNNQGNQKTWMKVHQQLLEKGKIEKLVLSLRSIGADNPDVARRFAPRQITSKEMRGVCAIQVSPSTSVGWLGCDRSRLQDGNRLPPQTIWNVLDRARSQRDSRSALLSSQPPL